MLLVVGYIALVAYAAALFVYSVTHARNWAAIGILLSISGFQLAMMGTVPQEVGMGLAFAGLASIARDVVTVLQPRLAAVVLRGDETASERA